jgi:hypothetical protein
MRSAYLSSLLVDTYTERQLVEGAQVHNRSKAPALLSFAPAVEVLSSHGISIVEPSKPTLLQPRQTLPVTLSFKYVPHHVGGLSRCDQVLKCDLYNKCSLSCIHCAPHIESLA